MNFSEYLKPVLGKDFVQLSEPVKTPYDRSAKILDLEIPLYGELLGIEVDILNKQQVFNEKLFVKLVVCLQKIKEKTKHGSINNKEAIKRLLAAIKNKGYYLLRNKSTVKEFSSDSIKEYDTFITLFSSDRQYNADLSYDVEGVLQTELRQLALDCMDSWIEAGVQGESLLELALNIREKENLIIDGEDSYVEILPIIEECVPEDVLSEVALYEFSFNELFPIRFLLYTRLGIDHDCTRYAKISELEKAIEEIDKEFTKPDPIVENKSNTKTPGKEEKQNTDSGEKPVKQ